MALKDFAAFINEKGEDAICCGFQVQPSTVRSWRSRNAIPRDRWPELLREWGEYGLGDLLRWEASRSSQRA